MAEAACNVLLIIVILAIVIWLIYYFNNKNKPIKNDGKLNDIMTVKKQQNMKSNTNGDELELDTEIIAQDHYKNIDGEEYQELSEEYQEPESEKGEVFTYGKKKYYYKSTKDLEKQFNSKDLMPQQKETDWFDDPYDNDNAEVIDNNRLIDTKKIFNLNPTGSSKRNMSHDIRGAIDIPKTNVGPFLNPTIDGDVSAGLCGDNSCNFRLPKYDYCD